MRGQVCNRELEQLFSGVSQCAARLVIAVHDAATIVVDEESIGRVVEELPQLPLALEQPSLSPLQLCEGRLQLVGTLGDSRFELLVETLDLRLGSLALCYVSRVDHHAPHGRIVEQVGHDVLEVAPAAVLVRHPELQWRVEPRSVQDLGEYAERFLPVVRMDGIECVGRYLLFGPVASDPLDRRACVADGAISIEDRDDI